MWGLHAKELVELCVRGIVEYCWICNDCVYVIDMICHDRDHTCPHSPHPDMSMSFLSPQNHPRAPLANSEPAGTSLGTTPASSVPQPHF